jgi:cell pole-organizing protein PopZ
MSREAFMRSSAPVEPDEDEPSFSAPASKPSTPAADVSEPSRASSHLAHDRSEEATSAKPAVNGHAFSADAGLNGAKAAEPSHAESAPDKSVAEKNADSQIEDKAAAETTSDADTKSIEAQLADLLGDDLQALDGAGAEHKDSDTGAADVVTGKSSDADSASPIIEPHTESEARPGFTVSRIGFTNGPTETADTDPFAFDLGPSPFSSAQAPKPAVQETSYEKTLRVDSMQPESEFSTTSTRAESFRTASHAVPMPEVSSAPASPIMPLPAAPASEPFAVPSVAATLGPHRTLEPLSASFRPAAPEYQPAAEFPSHASRPEPVHHEETGRDNRAHHSSHNGHNSVRAEFRGERLERMLQPAPTEVAPADRSMEDAMADLLRPLLRTWLAENMPKIVERALRREMTERLLPGQKGPFD